MNVVGSDRVEVLDEAVCVFEIVGEVGIQDD